MAAAAGAEKAADAAEPAADAAEPAAVASVEDKLALFYRPRLLARLAEFHSLVECARVLDENNDWLTARRCPEEMERNEIVSGVGEPTERAVAFASRYLITDCFRYAAAAEGRTRLFVVGALTRSVSGPISATVELRVPVDHYRRVVDPEYPPDKIHETLMITITCTTGAQHKNNKEVHHLNKILPVCVSISILLPSSDDEIHFEINEFLALLEEKLGVPCNTSGRAVKAANT